MAEGDLPVCEYKPLVWVVLLHNAISHISDGSYPDGISFHPQQQFVIPGDYSHKTETFRLSPITTWVSLTYWAWS